MQYNDETYISLRHTKNHFLDLNIKLDSDENWDEALEIFEDRIRGRYLNLIERLIKRNELLIDGFAIMALNCLLIETLLQFKHGWDETPHGINKKSYSDFLLEEFPHIFDKRKLADTFYSDIRCGILHSAQTKGKSKLTVGKDYVVTLRKAANKEYIKVDVNKITLEVIEYYNKYTQMIRNDRSELRENFRKKMYFICLK